MTEKPLILYAENEREVMSPTYRILQRATQTSGAYFLDAEIEEPFSDGNSLESRIRMGMENVAVVLTDHNMPGVTGGEIIKKYAGRFRDTAFILLYADEKEIGLEAMENGAFAYLLKPVDLSRLIETLKRGLISKKAKLSLQ